MYDVSIYIDLYRPVLCLFVVIHVGLITMLYFSLLGTMSFTSLQALPASLQALPAIGFVLSMILMNVMLCVCVISFMIIARTTI